MSMSGRDLRESLNGGSSNESENLVLYGTIAGVILLAAIVFVVVGLMSGSGSSTAAPVDTDAHIQSAQASIEDYDDTRIEEMSKYNQTINNIKSCMRSKNERKKFKEIEAGYERRNAQAVASWKRSRSKMLEKVENGTATDIDLTLWAASGAAQRDVMSELSDQLAMTGSFEMLSSDECLKFGSDVRMKKYDIKARP